MLKTFRGLVLGLVVLVGSAYVTPTYASSASIVITQIRAGSVGSSLDEMVILFNQTDTSIDITDWCLMNKVGKLFACFDEAPQGARLHLLPRSHAVVVSASLAMALSSEQYSIAYPPTHAGNGSIVASSDTISLLDANGEVVDQHGWTTLYSPPIFWQRLIAAIRGNVIEHYQDTDDFYDWFPTIVTDRPWDMPLPTTEWVMVSAEPDPDAELQPEPEDSPSSPTLRLSEIFPNPPGVDKGQEYIEIWNSGNTPLAVGDYQLLVAGGSSQKTYFLPDLFLEPGQYALITHEDAAFSLNNSSGRVALLYDDQTIDETTYDKPKENYTWARFGEVWHYTNHLTPGAVNVAVDFGDEDKEASTSSLKPCAANQYRNPETNRCRLLSTATKTPTPCKEGQVRNPETNRCRSASAGTSSPAPCKEGQERNPETNRCRNVKKVTEMDYGVLGVETEQEGGVPPWLIAGLIALGIFTYATWEWREEIRRFFGKLKARFARVSK